MTGVTRGKVVVVIPASLSSRRLPRKMLLAETGTPLIVHTWQQACRASAVDRVVVATGDEEIAAAVASAGGDVAHTPPALPSGTDRIAAASQEIEADYYINLQGDEPEIDPADIDAIAVALRDGSDDIVTLAQPIASEEEWGDPNTVKVVFDANGRALYFSRAAIPHPQRREGVPLADLGFKHVGIYGYSRDRLREFAAAPRSTLETREGLEQLRALDRGWSIRIVTSKGNTVGINSAEDYERFVASRREMSAKDKGAT